jgi:hypothetical protein
MNDRISVQYLMTVSLCSMSVSYVVWSRGTAKTLLDRLRRAVFAFVWARWPPRAGLAVPDVMRWLVEHGLAVILVAGHAQDPEMAHSAAVLGRLSGRGAEARFPPDELRHPLFQGMPERASLRTAGEQGNRHPMIMP